MLSIQDLQTIGEWAERMLIDNPTGTWDRAWLALADAADGLEARLALYPPLDPVAGEDIKAGIGRDELQKIRDVAIGEASRISQTYPKLSRAWWALADAADWLDAMIARTALIVLTEEEQDEWPAETDPSTWPVASTTNNNEPLSATASW